VPASRLPSFRLPADRLSAFHLCCLAYLGVALPGTSLGLLWPSIRLSFHQPVGALGLVLAFGVTASVLASAAAARLLGWLGTGLVVAAGTLLIGLALAEESAAPSLALFIGGTVVFGLGFGLLDAALNAYAARCFGPRQATWIHASYGLGACLGPLLVTGLLSAGVGWRWVYGSMAIQQAVLAVLLVAARRAWSPPPVSTLENTGRNGPRPVPADPARLPVPSRARLIAALTFAATESGIESGAGLWGYLFLTAGRGLGRPAAGLALAGYGATMFVGRAVLGPVAERLGAARVLAAAVAGLPLAAAVMAAPGPALVPAVGLLLLGLAAAPIVPLFTQSTAARTGAGRATRTVALQVAADAAGGTAVPAGLGLALGAGGAGRLAPLLLVLGLALLGLALWVMGWPLRNRTGARRVP
jgi:fucose permease